MNLHRWFRRLGSRGIAVVVAWGAVVCVGFPAHAVEPPGERVTAADLAVLSADANVALNLAASRIVTVRFAQTAGATIQAVVPIGDEIRTLDLEPFSVRADDYKLVAQLADGSYVSVDPGPITTYRGRVLEIDGSAVAGSMDENGLRAVMLLPDGHRHWLEPIGRRVAGAAADPYVLYRDDDVLPGSGTCATIAAPSSDEEVPSESANTAASGPLFISELAIDADVEYFQKYGSVQAAAAQINTVLNTMNLEYERDLNIRHILTQIIVRTAEPDPYASFDAGRLLNQLRDRWDTIDWNIHRDAVQLFTGKNLTGNIIGMAMTRTMCLIDAAYCLVESDSAACPSLACKTDLSAHELGHVWSAIHCSCPGWTMNPTITSGNRFHPVYDIPGMTAFRDARTCLSFGDPCDPAGTLDCNHNGVADACDLASGSSRDADGNGTPDECQPPPMPQGDTSIYNKNRVVSIWVPTSPTSAPGAQTAIRVRLVSLNDPNLSNAPVVPPADFSAFEFGPTCADPAGCVRWVGKPNTFLESQNNPGAGAFQAARLQCTPYYTDWTTEALVHVFGAEVIPGSFYNVENVAADCMGNEATCSLVSPRNILATARYADVVPPFNPPEFRGEPDALDVVALVDKFKNAPGALSKTWAQLQPNVPDLNGDVNALDIVAGVDAFKRFAYPFSGPCVCPSTVPCGATPCNTSAPCDGGLCVRTCLSGANDGEPCNNNTHCPGGTCSLGFCRDRCGRCSP